MGPVGEISSISIEPSNPKVGFPAVTSVGIKNVGDRTGDFGVQTFIDGAQAVMTFWRLNAGQTAIVQRGNIVFHSAGSHSIGANITLDSILHDTKEIDVAVT